MDDARLGPPAADCTVVELDGRVSVHSARSREVQVLNASASAVWWLLDGSRTLDDVVADVADLYGVAPRDVRADVVDVVARFRSAGLLPECVTGPGPSQQVELDALGVRLRLLVEDPALATTLRTALSDLVARPAEADAQPIRVDVTGTGQWHVRSPAHVATASSPEAALGHTLTAVNLTAVEATSLLAFHAAVLTRGSRTLVVPARSGTGKSTLTASLLRAGWAYVSDEALALDWATGEVVGYPRPMALSPWSVDAVGGVRGLQSLGELVVRPADLDADVDRRPGPVTHVALLERGAGPVVVEPVADRNEALEELLRRGFTHHRNGGRALLLLADLLRAAAVVRVRLGDPRDAARALTEAVG